MSEKVWTVYYSGRNLAASMVAFCLEAEALEYAALWNEEYKARPWGSFLYVVEGFAGYGDFSYF